MVDLRWLLSVVFRKTELRVGAIEWCFMVEVILIFQRWRFGSLMLTVVIWRFERLQVKYFCENDGEAHSGRRRKHRFMGLV